jgi:hypothetical protein
MEIKRLLITCADWFDDKILQHRFHWLCWRIGMSPWWGDTNNAVDLMHELNIRDDSEKTEDSAPILA